MSEVSEPVAPTLKRMLASPVHLFAMGFGSGLLPRAPGTWGSVAALLLFVLLYPALAWQGWAWLTLISFLLGVPICARSAELLGVHDHGAIVWDEFVGQWLVLLAALYLPLSAGLPVLCVLSFVLFRLFDITKPWPIRQADARVVGGLGIMLDDVLAAVYAVAVLLLISLVW